MIIFILFIALFVLRVILRLHNRCPIDTKQEPILVDTFYDAAYAMYYPDTEEWYYYSKTHLKGFTIQSDILLTEDEIHRIAYESKMSEYD